MQKIIKMQKNTKPNYHKLSEVISIIMNNLNLITKLLDLFEKFIMESFAKNKRKKLHAETLKINLMNNKEHINLEYIKYSSQLNLLIDYFFEFSKNIDSQFKNSIY